jgi:hypothetical protein
MNFNNLEAFMRTEIPILITVLAIVFGIKFFRNQEWIKFASVLTFSAILIGVARGGDIWSFFNSILRWFGLNL